MKTLTQKDITHTGQVLDLGTGLFALVTTERDETADAPWEMADGHGPVSEWTTRDKAPGERVIASDRSSKLDYDFAEAMRIAKRDGWGISAQARAALTAGRGRTPTAGEVCTIAVEHDFQFLKGWCDDRWEYIGVIVKLYTADDANAGDDSLWGIESCENPGFGFYWKETAADMVNALVAEYTRKTADLAAYEAKETAERAQWEARDTITV